MFVVDDDLEDELGLPRAGTTCRRDRRPRVQQGRLLSLRGDRRPSLPRRHHAGQRRGLAAHARAAPQVPAALPQRLKRALVHPAARRGPPLPRITATAACSTAVPRARVNYASGRADRPHPRFRAYGPGDEIVLRDEDGRRTVPVMRFDVAGGGGREEFKVPSRLRPLSRCRSQRAPSWELGLGTAAWQIDGLGSTRPDRRAPAPGRRESGPSSTAAPRAPDAHPRLPVPRAERPSRPVETTDRIGWKDTVGVLPDGTVTVLTSFAPYSRYVFHCHALERADKAMMLQLEVVSSRRPLTAAAALTAALAFRRGGRRPDRPRRRRHAATTPATAAGLRTP